MWRVTEAITRRNDTGTIVREYQTEEEAQRAFKKAQAKYGQRGYTFRPRPRLERVETK